MIERPQYLEKLKTRMWNDSIKIITGIRRAGKSFLLNTIFYEYLISTGVEKGQIIKFAFDSAVDLEKIGEDLIEIKTQLLRKLCTKSTDTSWLCSLRCSIS